KSIGIGELLDRPAATYSGGQRRRLEIARALVSRPQVLFLDEPTVGLDPRIRHELLDVIAGLRDHSEMTILLTTHYLDEAQRLCDRVAIMHDGRIVALDTLRSNGLAGDEAFAVGSTVTLPLNGHSAADAIASARDIGLQLASISTREPTLDDVYLRLTGDRLDDAA